MSVGLKITKEEIDTRMGQLARDFQGLFADEIILKSFFDSTTDPTLVALGYTAGEVAVLKSAIADIEQLRRISVGEITLVASKDFTIFLKQIWGVGA